MLDGHMCHVSRLVFFFIDRKPVIILYTADNVLNKAVEIFNVYCLTFLSGNDDLHV